MTLGKRNPFSAQRYSVSSGTDAVVGEQFLHSLDLAFVLGHGLVVHAGFQQMLLAVMDLGSVLQLEGAQGFQRPQQNLRATIKISEFFFFFSFSEPENEHAAALKPSRFRRPRAHGHPTKSPLRQIDLEGQPENVGVTV